jgi:hypothetical protein
MGLKLLHPVDAGKARWLSMGRGIDFIFGNYKALMKFVRAEAADSEPAAIGLVEIMKTPEFVGTMLLFKDMWPRLRHMNLAFQVRAVCAIFSFSVFSFLFLFFPH